MAKTLSRAELLARAAAVRAALTGYVNGLTVAESTEQVISGLHEKLLEIAGKDGAIGDLVKQQLAGLAKNKLIGHHKEGHLNFYSGKKIAKAQVPRTYTKKEKPAAVSSMPHLDFRWDEKNEVVHVRTPKFTFTFGLSDIKPLKGVSNV